MKLLACQRENNVIESEEEEEDALRDDVGVEQGDEELSDSHQDNSMRLLVSDGKEGGELESEEENSLGKDLAAREPGVETEVEEEEEEEAAEIFGSFEKIEKSEVEQLVCSGLRNSESAADSSSSRQVGRKEDDDDDDGEEEVEFEKKQNGGGEERGIAKKLVAMAQVCEKEKKETGNRGSKEKPSDMEDKIVGFKKTQTDTKKTTCEGKKQSERYLVSAEDAPVYNLEVGITSGYRQPLCYAGCLRSVFQIHNETVNIWTHLLGFVFFLWLLFDNCFRYQNHLRDKMDLVATCLQLLSYQVCMVNSAAFHTFLCHSKETKATWHSADHCGILLAFLGTYIRIIITTLRCFPEERLAHLTIVFLLFGTVIAFKYWPGSRGDAKVPLSLFYALALYVIAPFAHWVHLSHRAQQYYVTTSMVLWMWSPYLVASIGLGFYLSRWPEKLVGGCWTGCVDIYGHSHQFWHVFIFSAMAWWHYLASWVSLQSPAVCQGTDVQDSLLISSP